MSPAKRSIRFKVSVLLLVPLISLGALWAYAASITLGDGLNLIRIDTLYNRVAAPSEKVVIQLQDERRLSVTSLRSGRVADRRRLTEQREATDRADREFRGLAESADARRAASPDLRQRINDLIEDLDGLDDLRARLDSRAASQLEIIESYGAIVDTAFRFYASMILVPDIEVHQQAQGLTAFGKAREVITQESALIAGMTAAGRMTGEERRALTKMALERRLLFEDGLAKLDSELRAPYDRLIGSPGFRRFTALERRLTGGGPGKTLLPAAGEWRTVSGNLVKEINQLQVDQSGRLVDRTMPIAIGILVQLGAAGFLGLVAVTVSIFLSVRFGRRLTRELRDLRNAATALATERLPKVVARLRRGERVDVAAEAPALQTGGTQEIDDVGGAFTSVQRTAVEAAVGQARLREGVNQVFRNLARRSQSLLHRQLGLLDTMQRRNPGPDTLKDLYSMDHLTTRMRRHAENLIILSDAVPGRGWRRPVHIADVLRGAVSEVEDYTRVTVFPLPDVALTGSVVADVIHLMAELIENATRFSPSHTRVHIRGEMVAHGFAVEIEDRGLGMTGDEYAVLNDQLIEVPEFDLADSDRLGLFVVGRLAARHNIKVVLRSSPFGGTTAIVLIPHDLLAEVAEVPGEGSRPALEMASAVAVPPAGTGTGLPRRVRRAAVQSRPEPEEGAAAERSAEESRSMFSAIQSGWRRGRRDTDESTTPARLEPEE